MRHLMRALLGVVLVGLSCCQLMAAETGSKFWPFGKGRSTDATSSMDAASVAEMPAPATTDQGATSKPYPTTGDYPTTTELEPERRWMLSSPLAKVSWPRIHMPELPKPQLPPSPWPKKSEIDAARNSWVEKSPEPAKPSPLQAMKSGAHRVGESTRNAWDKTVDAITPGDQSKTPNSSRVARRDRKPIWKRMFESDELQQPEGPQTITEWMAQDRLDP